MSADNITQPRYIVTWPSGPETACVTVVQDGSRATFGSYADGLADDSFDVALYGDRYGTAEDRRYYAESLAALDAIVALANLALEANR